LGSTGGAEKNAGGFKLKSDVIAALEIDASGRLRIYPAKEEFVLIYRTATEIHWDKNGRFLYSPTPREWSYLDWFNHIINVIEVECYCRLTITIDTNWTNIDEGLKKQISGE